MPVASLTSKSTQALVDVALFGDEGVGDALVLDDDGGGEGFAGGDGERLEAEGAI